MAQEQLKRSLGLWQCVFFGVGAILGAGIYALIGKAAGMGGNMVWVAFIIASITALCSAFSYAELSSMFPAAGGEYVYAKNALGKKTGVALGIFISLNGIITGAAVSIAFAGYFAKLLNIDPLITSLGIIILLIVVNAIGIRESSAINIVFTIVELSGLALVIYAASGEIGSVDYFELPPTGITGILSAAALSFFAYIGFEEIVKLAEETKEPTKNIPRALFIASAIVMVVYLAVTISAISAMNWQELSQSRSPLADIVSKEWGNAGGIIIAIIALFSTSNTILSNMLGSSRVLYSMAKEVHIFRSLSTVHVTRKTPIASLLLVLVIMVAFALIGNIQTVALLANVFIFLTFLIVNISVIVLRVRHPRAKRPYRMPLSIGKIPVIPLIAVICILVLVSFTVYNLAQGIL
jgi:basic amino acid/polyamine antiporter, APA family